MKKTITVQIKTCIEMEVERQVKVKSHTRFQNGKVVKVKGHYRKLGF